MAKLRFHSPFDILEAAAAKRGDRVPIGHNRWAELAPDGRVLFGLHQSSLVAWNPTERTVHVRHAGWRTATTRTALCDFLSLFGPANAAERGGCAMLRGEWREVDRDFGEPFRL